MVVEESRRDLLSFRPTKTSIQAHLLAEQSSQVGLLLLVFFVDSSSVLGSFQLLLCLGFSHSFVMFRLGGPKHLQTRTTTRRRTRSGFVCAVKFNEFASGQKAKEKEREKQMNKLIAVCATGCRLYVKR